MTFQELINQIKREARVADDTNFDQICIDLINEMSKEAVSNERPFELRSEILLSVDANGLVTLPVDFFIHHQVIFLDVTTGRSYPLVDQDKPAQPAPIGMYGHPKTFEVMSSSTIQIKPTISLVAGDQVNLIYYKNPFSVTSAGLITTNPIPRLEPFLVRTVVRRIRMLHSDDVQVAQMLAGDVSSAAKAYVSDEPEVKEDK